MTTLPLMAPTFIVGLLLGLLFARRLGAVLRSSPLVAFLLVASVALVVAVTLTPLREVPGAVDPMAAVPDVGGPLWRWPWQWWPVDDRTLNVVLFVPLGLAVGLVGRTVVRRWLTVAALVSPLVVEGTQWAVDWLARDSQWQDVADNLVGVVLGLLLGWVVRAGRGRSASD